MDDFSVKCTQCDYEVPSEDVFLLHDPFEDDYLPFCSMMHVYDYLDTLSTEDIVEIALDPENGPLFRPEEQ